MPVSASRLVHCCCVVALFGAAVIMPDARAQEGEAAPSETSSEPAASNIEKRLRRIEDSLIDMRGMIGALQSFAPGDGTASGIETLPSDQDAPQDMAADPFGADAAEDRLGRTGTSGSPLSNPEITQLEIQVQALAAQLSETVKRLDRLEAAIGRPSDQPGDADVPAEPSVDSESPDVAAPAVDPDVETGFGTTTVQTQDTSEDVPSAWPDDTLTAEADAAGGPEAQALFTQAYDALQAQDYAAARSGFESFLDTYPDDPLANNARYWLADAAFAEGDYVAAANNFVRVYNTAPTGEKAEETLLKLAIVLRRLDRPESACDALGRLDGRLEDMPDSFRQQVDTERQASGCG